MPEPRDGRSIRKGVDTFISDRGKSARVEIISPDGSRTPLQALFNIFTCRQLSVTAKRAIPGHMAVTVEYEDVLFLGEVRRCEANDNGLFQIEIDVKQTVNSLTTLMRLRAALLEANTLAQPDLTLECVGIRRSP